MLRRIRDLVLAGMVGGVLVLGGTALADIPDTQPSAPDPAHTLAFCYRDGTAPFKSGSGLFDLSQGAAQGKPNCETALGTGWHTVYAVPAIPAP